MALTPEERRERASKAGKTAQSVATYVKNIVKNAPDLTHEDIEALRRVVGPVTAPDVYAEGVRVGAKMAIDRIAHLAAEVG